MVRWPECRDVSGHRYGGIVGHETRPQLAAIMHAAGRVLHLPPVLLPWRLCGGEENAETHQHLTWRHQ